ncbi:unnamed protein product [Microthlaspi erraticum]|uniref:BHLH domain-containing protein n=1 Tax=Microthlaspi erraticum TaxID=1685480 RepID=A0A6D2KUP4_9BRAS|nr:unnamed protein product [Microthlaspi erraticum]
MEINNRNEGSHDEEELCSLSEIISSICSEDHTELNPLREIFGAQSGSGLDYSEPTDVITRNSTNQNLEEESDTRDRNNKKRQRSMEYRVMMEKKRRQIIRDKVDILQEMTPNCAKSDLAAKLESIVEYIKSLKHQRDVMSKAYTETVGYMPPFYGGQAPCISPYTTPWGYYAPTTPMVPIIPQFHQVHDTAPPNQTQP